MVHPVYHRNVKCSFGVCDTLFWCMLRNFLASCARFTLEVYGMQSFGAWYA